MDTLLSLTRAARLIGTSRVELQHKIQSGELPSFDGKVAVTDLLRCYPQAQLEDDAEVRRIKQIKERAFGKRVFERALPDAEVLAARVTELSKKLALNQAQVKRFEGLLAGLWDKLDSYELPAEMADALKRWLKQEVAMAVEPGFTNPLAIKEGVLQVMTAQVTVLPSQQDFLVEGQDTLLEAAMRAGIPLNYGCSGGNCGLCKAKVVSGEVKKTRHHDFVLSEADKAHGYVLLCSNTAVSDVQIEAAVAGGVQDIPFQQITARVKVMNALGDDMLLLHLETPRSQRLRFLAGQRVTLRVGQAFTAELPIASCPCDDRNLLFHLHRLPGNLFSDYVFERLKRSDSVEIEGPQGEFILRERSSRPQYFIAIDGGFAPVKSLIEHAMSLNAESIHLHWVGSTPAWLYMTNVPRAWTDALDNFHYSEHVLGTNLHTPGSKAEEAMLDLLQRMVAQDQGLLEGDIYLAGPDAVLQHAEAYFLGHGLPKTRVAIEVVN